MPCDLCALTPKVRAALDPADYDDACDACVEDMTPEPSQWRMACVGEHTWRLEQASYASEDDFIAALDHRRAGSPEPDPPRHTVREAMESLNEKYRRAIEMYYFEGKTYREIGEHFGISKQAAHKRRVQRGLEILRETYLNHEDFRNSDGDFE